KYRGGKKCVRAEILAGLKLYVGVCLAGRAKN
ncbi:unnamed protein product, partial [marine sediment metagenome]